MNLDELDVFTPQPAVVPTPRRHRHRWQAIAGVGGIHHVCTAHATPVIRDETAARRGKSSRRLGGDTERRIERVYGPVKIGERGDPVDHIGRVWRWQSKATRTLPPKWLAAIDKPTWMLRIPDSLEAASIQMAGHYGGRQSVVIRSFVRQGVPTRDWLFVHTVVGKRELDLVPPMAWVTSGGGWWVIPGDWWLDHFGRDE